MYPTRLGIDAANKRMKRLIANGHHTEALLAACSTFEKTIHRMLKQLIISSGFRNKHADTLLGKFRNFNTQKEIWNCFDPNGKSLPEIIGNNHWQHVGGIFKMRNNLVHGTKVYKLDVCKEKTEKMFDIIDQTISKFKNEYGCDGWSRISIRQKSTLHVDPKIKIRNVSK